MSAEEPATQHAEALTNWLRLSSGWHFIDARPQRLGVAVSGGSDSMALLDLMIWHGGQAGFEVHAVTVDHGLRPEAKQEALLVAEYCAGRGVSHEVLTWEWDGKGNLQAQAREARYSLMADWAVRRGIDYVALGHTRDDQAETVVMRLTRMSGVDGLAGMPGAFERYDVTWVRPLLRHQRDDIRQYLTYQNVSWCDDPSNEDEAFERVRVRRAAAVLAEVGITQDTLVGIADNMQSAKWALQFYTEREVEDGLVEEDRGDLIIPEAPKEERLIPGEILRRVQIAILQWLSGNPYPPRNQAMINLVAEMAQADRHTLFGCMVTRLTDKGSSESRLRFSREYNAVKDTVSPTNQLWDGRWRLEGPHDAALEVRALGKALVECFDWRMTGMPQTSLQASPAVWQGNELISAPLAGFSNGWTAKATGRGNFAQFLLSR
ncbi:MAG: tRNA lysidine(34) synthetase TilS [Silicimonas sp.]|nr:tRNA lysidine(34) synthetase TilS [Silicimonas sp.]